VKYLKFNNEITEMNKQIGFLTKEYLTLKRRKVLHRRYRRIVTKSLCRIALHFSVLNG
jgi:hypothetical protein